MTLLCPTCGTENPTEARFCFTCGTALNDSVGSQLERKFATALFVDVVGSTSLGEREDPEVVRSLIRRLFDVVTPVIERHGGYVERFIGDGILALFGVPTVHEDDPVRAVRAGLEIQRVATELGQTLTNEGKPSLQVRIGIEAGDVLVDPERSAGSRDRILTGDALNTAARLQAEASPGGIVVGPTAHSATKDAIELRPLGPLALKGKVEAVPAWEAVQELHRDSKRPGLGLEARMVGRDEQLDLLLRTFRRVESERVTALVSIFGQAGIGKSRLVREFARSVEQRRLPPTIRTGRCLAYGNAPYSALADAVKTHCGILDDDPPETASTKANEAVAELFGGLELAASVSALVGGGSDRSFGREVLFDAWRQFLERIAGNNPLILVMEDIHWADDGLLEFINYLVDWGQGPILVVTLSRAELLDRRPTWGGGKRNYATISLGPLTAKETVAMVDDLLSTRLPDELGQMIVERSEGNPLFGEEIVRMLIDRGVIRASGPTGWQFAGGSVEFDVPRSIQSLIASRLDSLPRVEKSTLQDAAVVGRTFWLGAIESLSGRAGRLAIDRLRTKEIVVPSQTSAFSGELEFSFRHVLIRDVAYESLSKSLRADKHVQVAIWAEEQSGERREEIAGLLATHYLEALRYLDELAEGGDRRMRAERDAFRWAMTAGERTLRLWQRRESMRWFQSALNLAEAVAAPAERQAWLWESYGNACEGVEPYPYLATCFERARSLYQQLGSDRDLGRVEASLAWVAFQAGRDDDVRAHGERALALLERLGDSRDLAVTLRILGRYDRRRGRVAEAEAELRRAMEMAERIGDPVTRGWAMVYLGPLLRADGGRVGLALLERGLDVAREAKDLPLLAAAYVELSEAFEEVVGDYPRAEALMREGIEVARRAGSLANTAWMEGNLADYLMDMGRLEEAEAPAQNALRAARTVGESLRIAYCLSTIAHLDLMRGNIEPAERALDEVRSIVRDSPDPYAEGWVGFLGGLIAKVQGDQEEALRIFVEGARSLGDRVEVWGGQNFLLESVRTLALAGRNDEAGQIRGQLERMGQTSVPARAFQAWADGVLEPDRVKARDLLEDAARRMEGLGRRIDLGRCLIDLAAAERDVGDDPAPTLARARDILSSCGAVVFLPDATA
jgi:class 3 adenylate cyclase/tetratricopeptide (TPR) repeat protein